MSRRSSSRMLVSPEELLLELESSGRRVTVADPRPEARAAYRSAIHLAIRNALVPSGYGLRHQGRDHGDLTISLVELDPLDESDRPAAVPIPDNLGEAHPVVREITDDPGLMASSPGARDRALLIAQAIADECARLGYKVIPASELGATFAIVASGETFHLTLFEELEQQVVVDEEAMPQVKYEWQRARATVHEVPSGRLALRLGAGDRARTWADRKRWTLDQKLPAMFDEVRDRATTLSQARVARETRQRQLADEWERAVSRARHEYAEDLNRTRLEQQAKDFEKASRIRLYLDALERSIIPGDGAPQGSNVTEWVAWGREEANRIDPLLDPTRARHENAAEVRPEDLERFMPPGMSARRRPG